MNSLVLAGPWMVLNGLAAVTSDEAPSDSVTDHDNNTCVWVLYVGVPRGSTITHIYLDNITNLRCHVCMHMML